MAKRKRANNDLKYTKQKKILSNTNPPHKYGVSSDAPEGCSSCSTSDTCRVTRKRHEHHLTWKSCWAPTYINKYKYHLLNINSRQNEWEKRWTTYIMRLVCSVVLDTRCTFLWWTCSMVLDTTHTFLCLTYSMVLDTKSTLRGRRGHDRIVVEFTTTYVNSSYHH